MPPRLRTPRLDGFAAPRGRAHSSAKMPVLGPSRARGAPPDPALSDYGRRGRQRPAPRCRRTAYRREIDGLRAVAVLPVILFHAGFPAFAGGYLGVDVFFVISGYLITGILAARPARGPLLARPLLRAPRPPHPAGARPSCSSPASPSASPGCRRCSSRDLARASSPPPSRSPTSCSGGSSTTSAPTAEHLPLLHTWSLGIEEQFYLLFPLALAALWRWRPAGIAPVFCARRARASLAARRLGRRDSHPQTAFFLLPFRAWELLVGAGARHRRDRPAGPRPAGRARASRVIVAAMAAVPLGLLPGVAAAGARLRRHRPRHPLQRPRHRRQPPARPPAAGRHRPDQLQRLPLAPADPRLRPHPLRRRLCRRRRCSPSAPSRSCSPGRPGPSSSSPFRRRGAGSPRPPARPPPAPPSTALVALGLVGVCTDGLAARSSPAVQAILASVTDTNPWRDACKTDLDRRQPAAPPPGCLLDGTRPPSPSGATATPTRCRAACSPRAEAAGFRFYSVTRSACPPVPGLTRTGAAASPPATPSTAGWRLTSGSAGFTSPCSPRAGPPASPPAAFDNLEGGVEARPGDVLTPIGADPRDDADRAGAGRSPPTSAAIEALLDAGHRGRARLPDPRGRLERPGGARPPPRGSPRARHARTARAVYAPARPRSSPPSTPSTAPTSSGSARPTSSATRPCPAAASTASATGRSISTTTTSTPTAPAWSPR